MQVLRMFEYERIRRVVYCIQACLPTDSKALFVKVRIHNTAGEKVPMYWWSNIAVNETPRTRVLAPADEALECHYTGTSYWLGKVGVPETKEEGDCTYPVNLKISKDFFYCVPDEQRKWVAAVEADGKGLFEASTHHLRGRKIFSGEWGQAAAIGRSSFLRKGAHILKFKLVWPVRSWNIFLWKAGESLGVHGSLRPD